MESDLSKNSPSADDVLRFLAENPDFFDQYPEALDELSISHNSDGAVSLVERQVAVLRERNAELRRRFDLLVNRAEQNEALLAATQEVIAALAVRGQHEDTSSLFSSLMRKHFDIDHAVYQLLDENALAPASKTALHLLGSKHSTIGPVRSNELSALFGVSSGDGSAAVALVTHRLGPKAFIAVGSSSATRYSAADGTMFLEYLAKVMGSLTMTSSLITDQSTADKSTSGTTDSSA